MDIFKIAAIALIGTILSVVMKQHRPEYTILVQIGTGLAIIAIIASDFQSLINSLTRLTNEAGIDGNYLKLLIKVLGTALITQIAADSCKDNGNTALATKLDIAGRVIILAISLPLIEAVLNFALELAKG